MLKRKRILGKFFSSSTTLVVISLPCNYPLSKSFFLGPNTTSIVQPLDQGVIHSFKCHHYQMLVKRIIAQCTMICNVDQIMVTAFDASRWTAVARNKVTDITARSCFRTAGFSLMLSDQQTFKNDALSTDDGSNQDPTKQLSDLLSHVRIDDNQPSTEELVNTDSNILVFNEWNNTRDLLVKIVSVDHFEDNEDEQPVKEPPPNSSEALGMLRRSRLVASTEQPQLY